MDAHTLTQLVSAVIADAPDLTYDVLVKEVLNRIDPADYEAALVVALRVLVREVMVSQRRPGPFNADPPTPQGDDDSGPRSGASWRVAAWQDGFLDRLDEAYATPTGMKRLRDMTATDLRYQADLLRGQAKAMFGRAAAHDRLADSLDAHSAATVGDLAREVTP